MWRITHQSTPSLYSVLQHRNSQILVLFLSLSFQPSLPPPPTPFCFIGGWDRTMLNSPENVPWDQSSPWSLVWGSSWWWEARAAGRDKADSLLTPRAFRFQSELWPGTKVWSGEGSIHMDDGLYLECVLDIIQIVHQSQSKGPWCVCRVFQHGPVMI